MRISELLKSDSTPKARKFLKLAEDIIDRDKRLIIRKRQLEELKRSF